MIKYRRYENEEELAFIYRVCSHKTDIGTWEDVADILNKELDYEYTSSKYRKDFQSFEKVLNANQDKFSDIESQLDEIKEQRIELAKDRQKISDERTEYKRLLREQARNESFIDLVKKTIIENTCPIELAQSNRELNVIGDNDLLIHLTDLHTGIKIDNFKNTFNEEVLADRLSQYLFKIKEIQQTHNSEKCYLVCAELVSGFIHNNLRLENNLDIIEQFKLASTLISKFVIELHKIFNEIHIYTTLANHSRLHAKKEENLIGENLDLLLPHYLSASLDKYDNIHIYENEIEQTIAMFNIRGIKVFSSHGDRDNINTVVQKYTMMFGVKPDIVLLGHRHTNSLTTIYDTKVIQSGCVSGTDTYAISHRLANKPEQTVSVINKNGLVCLYDIVLE